MRCANMRSNSSASLGICPMTVRSSWTDISSPNLERVTMVWSSSRKAAVMADWAATGERAELAFGACAEPAAGASAVMAERAADEGAGAGIDCGMAATTDSSRRGSA